MIYQPDLSSPDFNVIRSGSPGFGNEGDGYLVLGDQGAASRPISCPCGKRYRPVPKGTNTFVAFFNVLMPQQVRQLALFGNATAKVVMVACVHGKPPHIERCSQIECRWEEAVKRMTRLVTKELWSQQKRHRKGWRNRIWRGWQESNLRPLASEANTLSTELQPLLSGPHSISPAPFSRLQGCFAIICRRLQ